MLVILSGSSGVGKNTVINRLMEDDDRLELLTTVTTRAMREGESQWNPYYFVSADEFQAMIDRGEMVEYCKIHENYYGTNRKILEEKTALGTILIKDIDVEGTMALTKALPDVVSIYLTIDKETLRERLVGRGETQIDLRLKRYDYEETMRAHYQHVIYNDDLEKTVDTIKGIIEQAQKNG